jgi:hypothetical protein
MRKYYNSLTLDQMYEIVVCAFTIYLMDKESLTKDAACARVGDLMAATHIILAASKPELSLHMIQ